MAALTEEWIVSSFLSRWSHRIPRTSRGVTGGLCLFEYRWNWMGDTKRAQGLEVVKNLHPLIFSQILPLFALTPKGLRSLLEHNFYIISRVCRMVLHLLGGERRWIKYGKLTKSFVDFLGVVFNLNIYVFVVAACNKMSVKINWKFSVSSLVVPSFQERNKGFPKVLFSKLTAQVNRWLYPDELSW